MGFFFGFVGVFDSVLMDAFVALTLAPSFIMVRVVTFSVVWKPCISARRFVPRDGCALDVGIPFWQDRVRHRVVVQIDGAGARVFWFCSRLTRSLVAE